MLQWSWPAYHWFFVTAEQVATAVVDFLRENLLWILKCFELSVRDG